MLVGAMRRLVSVAVMRHVRPVAGRWLAAWLAAKVEALRFSAATSDGTGHTNRIAKPERVINQCNLSRTIFKSILLG